jgi:hypothetical protein
LPQPASAADTTNRTIAIFFILSSPLLVLIPLLGACHAAKNESGYMPAQGSVPAAGGGVC